MKAKLSTHFLVALFTALIFSCGSDDSTPANNFNYKGKTYSLKAGIVDLDLDTKPGQAYYHGITLYGGYTIENHDIAGTGNAITIGLLCGSPTIEVGTYTYNENESTYKAGDIASTVLLVNYNTVEKTGEFISVENPKAIIKKSGEVYTIDAEYTVAGKLEKAHFIGELPLR